MKPKNKEEALRMMDELKKYIEEEDEPVWCDKDISRIGNLNSAIVYFYTQDEEKRSIIRHNSSDTRPFLYSVLDRDNFAEILSLESAEMVSYLNKGKCKKA